MSQLDIYLKIRWASKDFQYILFLFFLFLLLIYLISTVAFQARHFEKGKEIIFLKTPRQALDEWKSRNLRGRTLLYIGSKLPLKTPLLNLTSDPETNLQSLNSMVNVKEISPENDNFLYPALLEGIFRQLIWVVPDRNWGKKKVNVQTYLFQEKPGFESYAMLEGSPLVICKLKKVPSIKEKLLVYIDACSLQGDFISSFPQVFQEKGISADLITVSANSDTAPGLKALIGKFNFIQKNEE